MTEIGPGGREFAELVADHVFRHKLGDMLLTIVNAESQPHELWQYSGPAGPYLDYVIPS